MTNKIRMQKQNSLFLLKLSQVFTEADERWRHKSILQALGEQTHITLTQKTKLQHELHPDSVWLLFLFQQALRWLAANMGRWNAWEWEGNIRGSCLVCHQTSFLNCWTWQNHWQRRVRFQQIGRLVVTPALNVVLESVAGIGEELVLWLKISSEKAVVSTSLWPFSCMWPLLRPRSVLLNA